MSNQIKFIPLSDSTTVLHPSEMAFFTQLVGRRVSDAAPILSIFVLIEKVNFMLKKAGLFQKWKNKEDIELASSSENTLLWWITNSASNAKIKVHNVDLTIICAQGLESEQCVELGRGKVSTLSFRTELHKLPPDFWSKVSQLEKFDETITFKWRLHTRALITAR